MVSGNITIANTNAMNTSFIMPNTAVAVRAVFETGQAVTASGNTVVGYTISGGTVILDMPAEKVSEIATAATGGAAWIDMTRVPNSINVTMPKSALSQLVSSNLGVELRLSQGTILLNRTAANSIVTQAGDTTVTASINSVAQSSLTASERQKIKTSDMVFNIRVASGAQTISTFNNGVITVTLPYTGQLPVAVWHLSGSTLEKLSSTYNTTARTVTFTTTNLSLFVVGWDGADETYVDVLPGDWFYNDVMFISGTTLMGAVRVDTNKNLQWFSPNTYLTRGMIVTILHRKEGTPSASGMRNPFSDVSAGLWYTDAVLWAAENNIVTGYTSGRFGPNDYITRQDLAVILMRYADHAKVTLPKVNTYQSFSDDNRISTHARSAVQRAVEAGIIGGRPNNMFAPLGNSTRAETAAMLHRFINAAY